MTTSPYPQQSYRSVDSTHCDVTTNYQSLYVVISASCSLNVTLIMTVAVLVRIHIQRKYPGKY